MAYVTGNLPDITASSCMVHESLAATITSNDASVHYYDGVHYNDGVLPQPWPAWGKVQGPAQSTAIMMTRDYSSHDQVFQAIET